MRPNRHSSGDPDDDQVISRFLARQPTHPLTQSHFEKSSVMPLAATATNLGSASEAECRFATYHDENLPPPDVLQLVEPLRGDSASQAVHVQHEINKNDTRSNVPALGSGDEFSLIRPGLELVQIGICGSQPAKSSTLRYAESSFELIRPLPGSIYSDLTVEETRRLRQETLAKRIQEKRTKRIASVSKSSETVPAAETPSKISTLRKTYEIDELHGILLRQSTSGDSTPLQQAGFCYSTASAINRVVTKILKDSDLLSKSRVATSYERETRAHASSSTVGVLAKAAINASSGDFTPDLEVKVDGQADRENQLFFDTYPKPEHRDGYRAQTRRVKLRNLPTDSTAKSVASLVWGGPIEQIQYNPGSSSALVLFLHHEHAVNYAEQSANGIFLPENSSRIIWVELENQVIPLSSFAKECMQKASTRCVRAVGIDEDFSIGAISFRAQGKNKERKVEHILVKKMASGARAAEFRFCSIKDAVAFSSLLQNDPDWATCNVQYFADPCAVHSGFRHRSETSIMLHNNGQDS